MEKLRINQWVHGTAMLAVLGLVPVALAQTPPAVTPGQRATAEQVAQAGVPLNELAPNAPDSHTVKSGDTLWGISGLFLKSPWRWPELWGMNLQDIRNPHKIYPGQVLVLEKSNGRAVLRARQAGADQPPTETVRVSPRTRFSSLADSAIPTIQSHLIEPFLAEPLVVEEKVLAEAPRIVAAQEGRVLLSRSDRAYARGGLTEAKGKQEFRVFRNAVPLKDPGTGEILGYEAHYLGNAVLVRGESTREVKDKDGKVQTEVIPATIDIVSTKEEMRVGDRLLPAPQRDLVSYVPRAPLMRAEGRIVSMYGSAVAFVGQNQIVTINRGAKDGMERGHVLALIRDGESLADRTDGKRAQIKLPDERNGLMMVFLTFERVSYALVLQSSDAIKVGDRFTSPR